MTERTRTERYRRSSQSIWVWLSDSPDWGLGLPRALWFVFLAPLAIGCFPITIPVALIGWVTGGQSPKRRNRRRSSLGGMAGRSASSEPTGAPGRWVKSTHVRNDDLF